MAAEQPRKWAIEDSFPIVEINRLALRERGAFRPVYEMLKWFARRTSCTFRAILLGALKPLPAGHDGNFTKSGAALIMEEFYRDHRRDPDTNGKVILDPFMGGGTTVVEALRLGCKVIGIDLNPVAWFIVKCETTPVNPKDLERAFSDLANRVVPWSGKPLRQTLLELYKTTCPCCGNADADIVYVFWVRLAICTNPTCGKQVPLFPNYIVAARRPSIRYHQDASCPRCHKTFDWEIEPASLIAEHTLTIVNSNDGAGVGRGNKRWSFAAEEPVACPWCGELTKPTLSPGKTKIFRKKVPLTVLLCPHCGAVWQYRGTVPETVCCPACKHNYQPTRGNLVSDYDFVCSCGQRSGILDALRRIPSDSRRLLQPYAIQGFCPSCDGATEISEDDEDDQLRMFAELPEPKTQDLSGHSCRLSKYKGKFFVRIRPHDTARMQAAEDTWRRIYPSLVWPRSNIEYGFETHVGHDLPGHGFSRWADLFNTRQLLSLATLLTVIREEPSAELKDMLLGAFSQALRNNCLLCFYNAAADKLEPALSRKDFAPPKSPLEGNVWGTRFGRGTFASMLPRFLEGKQFCLTPCDRRHLGVDESGNPIFGDAPRTECIEATAENCHLHAASSHDLDSLSVPPTVDIVVTDPPYASNVNYSEIANFFYVWIRLLLKDRVQQFAPEFCPTADEIIAPRTSDRLASDTGVNGGQSSRAFKDAAMEQFENRLQRVFQQCAQRLSEGGLMVFTFHHEANRAWEAVLEAIMNTGFVLHAAYPCESEAMKGGFMGAQKIAYDIIHVCRRVSAAKAEPRSWAGIRQEIRRRARQEIETIERGRYGNEPLSPADVNIILIGKCLELYSRHYGHVLDHEGNNVPLHDALEAIRMEVDQLISIEQPLPSELADIDPVSYVYLVCLADKAFEIKGDELHKYTRGVIEPDELLKAGLIKKGRIGRGRHFEIKSPAERFGEIQERLGENSGGAQTVLPGMEETVAADTGGKLPFIDHVHFLIALVDGGENLRPWMERFRGKTPQIRAACEYLRQKQPRFADACAKILKFIEVTPLFG